MLYYVLAFLDCTCEYNCTFLGKGSALNLQRWVLPYPDYGEVEKNFRYLKMHIPNFYQVFPLMINGLREILNDYTGSP